MKTNLVGSPTEATKANTKPGNARNPAHEGIGASLHLCRNRLNNLKSENNFRQKVSNLKDGQQCRNETACMGKMLKTTGSHQKVSINVRMVSLEPGNKSSELVVPERRPSRVYPKLEEQSVGGGVALAPRSPDAQQTRLPGGSPSPPVLSEKGLVDGAVCPEELSRGGKPLLRPGK